MCKIRYADLKTNLLFPRNRSRFPNVVAKFEVTKLIICDSFDWCNHQCFKGKLNEVFIFYSQVSYQTWHKRIRIGGSIYIYSTKCYKHTIFIHQASSMVSLVIKPYLIFTILSSKPKFPCPVREMGEVIC